MQGTIKSFIELHERLEQKRQRLFDIARGLEVEQKLLLAAIYEGCPEAGGDRFCFRVGDTEFEIQRYVNLEIATYYLKKERDARDMGEITVATTEGIGPSHKFLTEAKADTAIAAAESSQPTEQPQCNKKTPVEKTKPRKKSK